jgi:hypothetical protein
MSYLQAADALSRDRKEPAMRRVVPLSVMWILIIGLLLISWPAWAQIPIQDYPSVAMRLNKTDFRPGETLRVDLRLRNPRPMLTTDMYVGLILPDGNTVLWLTNTSPLQGVITPFTQASDPRTFVPILRGVSWPVGMDVTQHNYLTYTFQGLETRGTYHLLVSWTKPGSLQDGRIDEGDILALALASFHFS